MQAHTCKHMRTCTHTHTCTHALTHTCTRADKQTRASGGCGRSGASAVVVVLAMVDRDADVSRAVVD
eukprot:12263927-Alexandrium_andersonii.AAC.1